MKKLILPIFLMLFAGSASAKGFDVNADGDVNSEDLSALITYILGKASEDGYDYDFDGNDKCDMRDVTLLIDFLKGQHTYVDLGLPSGTLWATTNVGADIPSGYGDYFAWGETTAKTSFYWTNYTLCGGNSSKLTKYNNNINYGSVDNKVTLEMSDDAARANWGALWRMPTDEEIAELRNTTYCKWTITTTVSGVKGFLVESKIEGYTDKSIFLPFGGYIENITTSQKGSTGYYWSSTLNEATPTTAYCMVIDNSNFTHCNIRAWGRSIRPVMK